jgi:hypothetical protein
MQFYTDGSTKLLRVHFDGVIEDLDSLHEFAAAPAERWSARDGWQPAWQGATSAILQTGDFERLQEHEVPAVPERMAAGAAKYA